MQEISIGDALRLGSAVVEAPHGMEIERCGVGMVYKALGVPSVDCSTINLLYAGVVDKAWPCPWCGQDELAHVNGVAGAAVIRHPFSEHYLTGQISIEDLALWLDFIGTAPTWKQVQDRIGTMPKFSTDHAKAARDGRHRPAAAEDATMHAEVERELVAG